MSGIEGLIEKTKGMIWSYPRVVEFCRSRGLVSKRSRNRVGTTAPIDAHLTKGRPQGLDPEPDSGPYLGFSLNLAPHAIGPVICDGLGDFWNQSLT